MADLDFSKFFANNSPLTPYTWSDADYLEGWNTVGATPPARTQFDALQNLTDKKLKYLNDIKAPINSPAFTGTPTAPTPAKSDKSTRIATTAWAGQWFDDVKNWINEAIAALDGFAPINSPAFTGTPTAPRPDQKDVSSQIATTNWVNQKIYDDVGRFTPYTGSGSGAHYIVIREFIDGGDKVLIQWGGGNVSPITSTTTITFPLTFDGHAPSLIVSSFSGAVLQYAPTVGAERVSFQVSVHDSMGVSANARFDWVAIGFAA